MSTPTATTLPEVCGATSVCWSPARLPVASKKRGRSRLIAEAVVTSIATGCVFAADSSFRTLALEPRHAATNPAAATSSSTRTTSFNFPIDLICLNYSSDCVRRGRSDSVQKKVSEMLCSAFVGDVQQTTIWIPEIVVERVVHHHADEAAHHDGRIDLDERSVPLSLADVPAQKLVNVSHKFIEEHLRELMLFECRVEQQALKLRIVFVMVERAE